LRLEIKDLTVRVGGFVLSDFSLSIAEGECVALMGPSGCGKTTLMEAVCGLRSGGVLSGRILLGGVDLTDLPPGARMIGLVPQDVALFPTLTVREQLEFGPKLHRWDRDEMRDRVEGLASDLGLSQLLDRLPKGLSGGEARRVALGRALALRPRLLCLDEALSGLDEARHDEVLQVIRKMIDREGVTALHVTHSRREANAIADRVVVMGPGEA
jgi:ABC-type sugar transport system ATPase subunit